MRCCEGGEAGDSLGLAPGNWWLRSGRTGRLDGWI